jgi:TolB-like protein/Tfp pilus assembly protein PilF
VPWPLDTTRPADHFARLQSALADRYRLERELGRVGSVTGYLARDLASDRPVALKLIDPSSTAAAGSARLLRELRAAGRVQHHHLLPLLDAGVVRIAEGDAVYYTVRFLAGETLRARLERDGPLSVAEALAIAEDVAAALCAAHAQGVGHGAVAPERVVLAGGEALLADLGVETALEPVPPAPRDDIRDLGLVLYEMLAGAPAPEGAVAPLRAGRGGIPEEVELTVAQMLAPPADRYRTAEEALGALRSASAAARAASLPGGTTAERLAVRRHVPARWTVFTFAVLGLLGLSLWLRYNAPELAPPAPPQLRPSSLAVLPFANATPDTSNRYLSDGLTRELTAAFGAVPGLRVAGSASAFRLGRSRMDQRRAGERLGVDVVLRGTVRPSEGRVRIRASLMSVREGFDLWSETYERDAMDFTAVQRDIVSAVAGVLRFRAAAGAGTTPATIESRDGYLRGLQVAEAGDAAGAIGLLEESIRLDSAYAPAWAALAAAWLRAPPGDSLGPAEIAGRARAAAARALALDSTLAEAHGVLGEVRFLHDWDWAGAEAALGRAVTLNPNLSLNHLRLAHLLLVVGRVDEALEAGRRAFQLSAFDPAVCLALARQSLQVGDYVRAEEYVERALALEPDARGADLLRGIIAAVTGRYGDAVPRLERAAADSARAVEPLAMLGWVHALAGRREPAREIQAGLQDPVPGRYVSSYWLAFLAEALGDRRAAFAALDRAVAERAPELVDLRIDARMDRLRVDRRFDALARRVGLP